MAVAFASLLSDKLNIIFKIHLSEQYFIHETAVIRCIVCIHLYCGWLKKNG